MTQKIKLPPAWGSAINDTGDGHVDLYSKDQVIQIIEADRQARGEPIAWGAFYFGGKRNGKLYNQSETEAQVDVYIADVHRSNDSITLRKGPLYTAPQPQQISDEWKQAIDHELVSFGTTADSYSSPKEAINALIDWNVSLATDPLVNGGFKLVPIDPKDETS